MERALRELERWGLLLVQDPQLPNLAAIVAGERVRGSWWGHPKGKEIYRVYNELAEHDDVATAKLVSGKVTFVHRRLFGALVAAGRDMTVSGLDAAERKLYRKVRKYGKARGKGPAADALQKRLLVAGDQVHTDEGHHELKLCTWEVFARAHKVTMRRRSPDKARAELEKALAAINAEFGASATLPWQK